MGVTYSVRVRRPDAPAHSPTSVQPNDTELLLKRVETLERKMSLLLFEREKALKSRSPTPPTPPTTPSIAPDNLSII